MILALGAALGLGLVLAVSPFLWPRHADAPARSAPRPVRVLRDRLSQAGLHTVSVATLLVVSGVLAVLASALVLAFVPVIPLAATGGALALVAPTVVVTVRARSRRTAHRSLWPDLVDHLVSAVRSGVALPDAVSTLALAGPTGARESFAGFERTYRATADFSISLDELKARLADPVADRVLEILRMSREVGGSELTTVLRNLASYLREETALRSEIEARASWVVNAARLGVAAPWIILLLLSTRPEAAAAYNSATGVAVIVGGLVATFVAYRIMIGIGRLPEEQRWFR